MIFYKYVVENHTSCTCGGINEKTPSNDKGEQGKPTTQCRICENSSVASDDNWRGEYSYICVQRP